jgi:hypothetical protein
MDTLKQKCMTLRILPVKSSLGDWWKYLLALALQFWVWVVLLVCKKQQKKKLRKNI